MNIYIIGARRYVKIGISRDVKHRLSEIQTGCPFPLRIYQSWCTSRARELERLSHSVLQNYRVAGEWFDIPHKPATLIVGMLVQSRPARNAFPDTPLEKSVVFCKGCAHCAVIPFVADNAAKFRCSNCKSNERAHVVRLMVNLLKRK